MAAAQALLCFGNRCRTEDTPGSSARTASTRSGDGGWLANSPSSQFWLRKNGQYEVRVHRGKVGAKAGVSMYGPDLLAKSFVPYEAWSAVNAPPAVKF
ncbi:MAG: hypothetical protein EXR82_04045 [Gammaproteobacteria bacterium]|nr:hypothetical protein [Gammaproteobacteria bacterium]